MKHHPTTRTRLLHAVIDEHKHTRYVEIEHSAWAESRLTKDYVVVKLNRPKKHVGRHGCKAKTYEFPAGSVITYLDDGSSVIADSTHVFLSDQRLTDKKQCQIVNTGGSIETIRHEVLRYPESEWSHSLLTGIHGRDTVLDTMDMENPFTGKPCLPPGELLDWHSEDIYEGIDLLPPIDQAPPPGWTESVFD